MGYIMPLCDNNFPFIAMYSIPLPARKHDCQEFHSSRVAFKKCNLNIAWFVIQLALCFYSKNIEGNAYFLKARFHEKFLQNKICTDIFKSWQVCTFSFTCVYYFLKWIIVSIEIHINITWLNIKCTFLLI